MLRKDVRLVSFWNMAIIYILQLAHRKKFISKSKTMQTYKLLL